MFGKWKRSIGILCVVALWHGQLNASLWDCLKHGHFYEAMTYSKDAVFKATTDFYANLKSVVAVSRSEFWKRTAGRDAFSELIYEQLTFPDFKPSPKQLKLIESSPSHKRFFQAAVLARKGVTNSLKVMKGLGLALTWRPWVFHARGQGDTYSQATMLAIRSTIVPLARFFLPFGEFLPARWEGPTAPIFKKMAINENYKPTAAEIQTLKKYRVYERFVELQRFRISTKVGKGYHQVKKVFRMTIVLMLAVGALMAMTLNQVVQVDGMITIQQHFNENRLKPHQIAFIQETVPFPHTAVQVGDMIFSPGQRTISVSTPSEYMRSQEMFRIAQKRGWVEKEEEGNGQPRKIVNENWSAFAKRKIREPIDGSINSIKGKVGAIMGRLYTATGWNKQPRSMYVVTLNVGVEKAEQIKRYWLDQVGKEYANNTMVWDCASESVYSLDPDDKLGLKRLYDASPGGVTQVFAALRVLGKSPYEVESVRLVMAEETNRPNYHLARNGYLAMLENKLFAHTLLINQVQRSWTDTWDDPEDRRWHTEHFEAWLDEQAKEAERLLVSKDLTDSYLANGAENQLDYFSETTDFIGETHGPEMRQKFLQKKVGPFYDEQIRYHQEKMESINLFPAERLNHAIRRDYFEKLRRAIPN